jgi:integrase/recombinase XerC
MFLGKFIQYIQYEKRYSPHTVSAYRSDLEQFVRFLNPVGQPIAISHPSEITHHDIRSWMVSDETLAPRSLNRKLATLRKYFKFLLQEGDIQTNPHRALPRQNAKEFAHRGRKRQAYRYAGW